MFEDFFFRNLWVVLPIWLILYIGDYYLTIFGARLYRSGASEHIEFEVGYELTPQFQKDVSRLRLFSRKFFLWVIISSFCIVCLWWSAQTYVNASYVYRWVCGGLILLELAIWGRHAHNILLFRAIAKHEGISGKIHYAKWLTYQISAVEFLGFSGVFLIGYIWTGSVTFLGGIVFILATAEEHSRMSRQAKLNTKLPEAD